MRHPTDGVLRRLLDEPAGVPTPDREHVGGCEDCLDRLATFQEDADLVGAALATGRRASDADAAWARLQDAPAGARATTTRPRGRRLVRRPAAAALAAAVVLGGAGTAAANDWLPVFRTEQVAPVSLSTDALVALPDLEGYGEVELSGDGDLGDVPDAATAAERTGLDVPEPGDLPSGVAGEPTYRAAGEISATFTFDAERAAAYAADSGGTLPPPPPGLDGSQVRLVAGPGVAAVWEQPAGVPALLVGRAVAPSAYSSGLPFEQVRDYLLTLPGLPDDVAAQLRTYAADGTTLPLPVPAEQVTTTTAQVGGTEATVLETRDRSLAAVVWVDDGVVTAVAGAFGADEVLDVAQGLR
jgi:hypothetical protein